jgi:hypothetical protein
MDDLQEIYAIQRLKHRYLRCLDQKRWDELAACFTEDATCAYGDGRYSYRGRDAIIEFLRTAMGAPSFLSSHRASHPEIDLTSPTTATGIWALQDLLIAPHCIFRGWGHYHDDYVKVGGSWKIRKSVVTRIRVEETWL